MCCCIEWLVYARFTEVVGSYKGWNWWGCGDVNMAGHTKPADIVVVSSVSPTAKDQMCCRGGSPRVMLTPLRGDADALEEHGEQMEMAVDEIATCLEETLDRVEELVRVHPCGEGVWRTVALEDSSTPCPPVWEELINPRGRFCAHPSSGCASVFFSIEEGGEYSRVCGRVRAVQFGQASAFRVGFRGLDGDYMTCPRRYEAEHSVTLSSCLREL